MKFRLGCELAYKVVNETVFIFNVSGCDSAAS